MDAAGHAARSSLGQRVNTRALVEWVWYGRGRAAALVRAALTPASMLYAAAMARRNARYDAQRHTAVTPAAPLPAVSIGNLTVGGTGKTPVASWFAARLHHAGARPALVLRGYGDDEWRVHQLLTPAVPVHVGVDRRAMLARAGKAGADCAVLDDAFQHRRAHRVADVVLISADRFDGSIRLLPAGPYREPLHALTRATAVVITVKSATPAMIQAVEAAVHAAVPAMPLAVVRLVPDGVGRVVGAIDPLVTENPVVQEPLASWQSGRKVVLVSAIADPSSFERQMREAGVTVVRHERYGDHHGYTPEDVSALVKTAQGTDGVLCTLKDAVKLGALWPRAGTPLWYVSQTLVVDRGADVLERVCDQVLTARTTTNPTAG